MPHGDVELQPLLQREGAVPVFEQDHAPALGLLAVADEFLAADDPFALGRVQIGVLKQTAAKDVQEQPPGGFLHPRAHGRLAQPLAAEPVRLQDRAGVVVAAELVHAVEDLIMPVVV